MVGAALGWVGLQPAIGNCPRRLSEDDPDHFDPEYYAQVILRLTQRHGDRIIQELDETGALVAAWDYGVCSGEHTLTDRLRN